MKLTLMIEGSASVIAAVLAGLPTDGSAIATNVAAPSPSIPPMPGAAPSGDDADDGPPNAAAPQFDVTGLPWDERIHSATKGLNADDSWKARRGGPKGAERAAIEAQLRAASGNNTAPVPSPMPTPVPSPMPTPVPSPQPVPMTTAPVPVPSPQPAPIPPMPVNPEPAPAPVPQPMVAPTPAPAPVVAPSPQPGSLDFPGFMQHIQAQMQKQDANGAPLVHADYLAGIATEISTAFGQPVKAITDIAANPQMITYASQAMQRDGRW